MCSFKEDFVMLPWYHIINISLLLIVYTYLGYMFYITEQEAVAKIKNTAYKFRRWAERLFTVGTYKKYWKQHLKVFDKIRHILKNMQFSWIEVFMSKISSIENQWLQLGTMFNFFYLKKSLSRLYLKRLEKDKKVLKTVKFSLQPIVSEYICDQDDAKQSRHNVRASPDFEIANMKMASVYMTDDNLTLSECLGYGRCNGMVEVKKVDYEVNGNGLELDNSLCNNDVFDACSDVGITELFEESPECELEDELATDLDCVSIVTNVDAKNERDKMKLRKPFRKRFTWWISKCFLCGRSNSD